MIENGQNLYTDRSIFLLFYQCYNLTTGVRQLSVLEIAVFNQDLCTDKDEDCVWISSVYNSSNLLYDIIDLALVNLTMTTVNIPDL